MSVKFKALIGVYILSILLFSGISKAALTEFDFSISRGQVFEANGYLYFKSTEHVAVLVHSSNFEFFKNFELPIQIEAQSIITSQQTTYVTTPKTIRFITNTIKEKANL